MDELLRDFLIETVESLGRAPVALANPLKAPTY
jgi:hypothetical protein